MTREEKYEEAMRLLKKAKDDLTEMDKELTKMEEIFYIKYDKKDKILH